MALIPALILALPGPPLVQLAKPHGPAGASAQPPVDWPQGSGPHGNWGAEGPAPPLRFSVRSGEGIRWKAPLPETGQGGIAVTADKLFVATMAPWNPENVLSEEDAKLYSHAIEKRAVAGKDIDAHCIDRATGRVLWTRRITSIVPSIYTYPFSDATSASPVASATHVWFTNAGGTVMCFTHEGETVWERRYTATYEGPFNKQFEPMLVEDGRPVLVHMEPFERKVAEAAEGKGAPERWHHLVGLDALTGEELWRSADTLTHYNAPAMVQTEDGPAALIARGGPHQVPERPVGVSLVRLTGPDAGQSIWRFEDPRGNHEASLQTMTSDDRFAYWLLKEPRNALVVLDIKTGEEVREISLIEGVTRTSYDPEAMALGAPQKVDLEKGVMPARYSMIAANGHLFFQCYALAWGKPKIGPAYSFARIDPAAGRVEYLEVPTDLVTDEAGRRLALWRTPRSARPLNSRGEEVTGDDRCRWDGWDWVFNGSPTRVNERLYFTLASGVVYVLDANTRAFDGSAILAVNDLGAPDQVWTANSVSYGAGSHGAGAAGGELYHRTGAHLIAIGVGQ